MQTLLRSRWERSVRFRADKVRGFIRAASALILGHLRERAERPRAVHLAVGLVRGDDLVRSLTLFPCLNLLMAGPIFEILGELWASPISSSFTIFYLKMQQFIKLAPKISFRGTGNALLTFFLISSFTPL